MIVMLMILRTVGGSWWFLRNLELCCNDICLLLFIAWNCKIFLVLTKCHDKWVWNYRKIREITFTFIHDFYEKSSFLGIHMPILGIIIYGIARYCKSSLKLEFSSRQIVLDFRTLSVKSLRVFPLENLLKIAVSEEKLQLTEKIEKLNTNKFFVAIF